MSERALKPKNLFKKKKKDRRALKAHKIDDSVEVHPESEYQAELLMATASAQAENLAVDTASSSHAHDSAEEHPESEYQAELLMATASAQAENLAVDTASSSHAHDSAEEQYEAENKSAHVVNENMDFIDPNNEHNDMGIQRCENFEEVPMPFLQEDNRSVEGDELHVEVVDVQPQDEAQVNAAVLVAQEDDGHDVEFQPQYQARENAAALIPNENIVEWNDEYNDMHIQCCEYYEEDAINVLEEEAIPIDENQLRVEVIEFQPLPSRLEENNNEQPHRRENFENSQSENETSNQETQEILDKGDSNWIKDCCCLS